MWFLESISFLMRFSLRGAEQSWIHVLRDSEKKLNWTSDLWAKLQFGKYSIKKSFQSTTDVSQNVQSTQALFNVSMFYWNEPWKCSSSAESGLNSVSGLIIIWKFVDNAFWSTQGNLGNFKRQMRILTSSVI